MSLRKVHHPIIVADVIPEDKKGSMQTAKEQIEEFMEGQKENNAVHIPSLKEKVEGRFNLPKEVEKLNNMPQPNQVKPMNQIHLPIGAGETTSAGNGSNPSIFFDANTVDYLYREGWHKATILAVEPTKPTQLKDGSLCQRAKFKWFLQDQQINLIDNVLLVHYQDSVIMQVINSCIQPNENRSQFDLLNLVNRQVMVRVEKSKKSNYFNVVEVKPLKNN